MGHLHGNDDTNFPCKQHAHWHTGQDQDDRQRYHGGGLIRTGNNADNGKDQSAKYSRGNSH